MEWFKFYTEFIDDPKMRRLSIKECGFWAIMLCMATKSPVFGSLYIGKGIKYEIQDIIKTLSIFEDNISEEKLKESLKKFETLEMIKYDENKAIVIKNFKDRQSSDHPRMMSERQKTHREKVKSQQDNSNVTDVSQQCNEDVTAMSRTDKTREEKKRLDRANPTQDFFNNGLEYQKVLDYFLEKKLLSSSKLDLEFKRFQNYWTEKSPNGIKQRWEMQKTFEVKARLRTWLDNLNKWNK